MLNKLRRALTLAACLASSSAAIAVPDTFLLGDGTAGPTCANYTGMGSMAWSRAGGDWIDAADKLYGDQPFATQSVPLGKGRQGEDWDVTELVRGWLDGRYPNAGMLLRAKPGGKNGVVDFNSRESPDASARPTLKLQWPDGSQTRLSPAADTFLDCTSLSSLGARPNMKVSATQSALLRFDLKRSEARLQQAVLTLVSDMRYASGTEIGVYRAAPPYTRLSGNIVTGLAKDFVRDAGIEKHPDVVFATGFESPVWPTEWGVFGPRSTAEAIADDAPRRFEPFSGRALRVRLVKGQNLGLDLRYLFAKGGKPEPEEIYFRYYLRFGDDWNPYADGGKMPGIAGTYDRAGWGMRKSDGYNGWSVRGGFAARPAADKSVAGLTALGSYAYHAESGESGDYWGWNEGPSGLLANNRWYAVEQYVKLNTPGLRDGIVRAWIDGRQVLEKTTILFRNTRDLKIENVWMNIYHGGTTTAPQDMTLYIDNVVIARRYIGPVK
ncbi:MAG: DNRLRE domain-containing protein [Polaromonas sp.]